MSVIVIRGLSNEEATRAAVELRHTEQFGMATFEVAETPNEAAISIIDEHTPSLTKEDEEDIDNSARLYVSNPGIERDIADLAIRTCACGMPIDGFYEYVDHLKEVLK